MNDHLQDEYDQALRNNDVAKAQYLHDRMRLEHEYEKEKINQTQFWPLNPDPWGDIGKLTAGPGTVYTTTTTNTAGDLVKWQKMKEFAEQFDQEKKEKALSREFKMFVHFARLFTERFPNWQVEIDPNDPFKNLFVQHKSKLFRIRRNYPANEILVNHHPSPDLGMNTKTIPLPDFYAWALGEEAPSWVKE